MNKIIGVPGWSTGDNSFGISKAYAEFLKNFGDVIVLSPNSFIPNLDLLVLPGGKDVIDAGAGDYSFLNSDGERFLEHFDRNTLPKYIEANIPIFGICRGMQTLAAHYKIPILQNIWWDHGHSDDEDDTDENTLTYSTEYAALGKQVGTKKIGSWHHQAVQLKSMEEQNEFKVIAYVDDKMGDDNVVEYIEHISKPIAATQSHPERNYDSLSIYLINKLINP